MVWLNAFKPRFSTLGIVLLPVCIAIDWGGRALASGNVPLFLDSLGTIIGGIFAGPWIGGIAGFISNLISSGTVDPVAAPYSWISLLLGFAAGVGGYLGWANRPSGWIKLWILCVLVASIGSTPLNLALYSGHSNISYGDAVFAALRGAHVPLVIASFVDELVVDLPDKLITVFLAVFVYLSVPARYRSVFQLYRAPESGVAADHELAG